MGKVFLEQYDGYKGIRFTSNTGEEVYFIRYGEFNTESEMEQATLTLTSYIYNIVDNKYRVFIGITKSEDNLIKLSNYYTAKGYSVYTDRYFINNSEFIKLLDNYDTILASTDDSMVIDSVNGQILEKYEELVNQNGSKN